jgi:hypothetical protein
MSEQQKTEFLRDTAVGFIFAGKDLIAVTLTWFFYMMCRHPNVEARILEELRVLQGSTWSGDISVFECDTLRSATYLQAALLEILRYDILNLIHLFLVMSITSQSCLKHITESVFIGISGFSRRHHLRRKRPLSMTSYQMAPR